VYQTLKEALRLKDTWRFLLLYVAFGDGYSTMASIGILFGYGIFMVENCVYSIKLSHHNALY